MSALSKLKPNRTPPFDGMAIASSLVGKILQKMKVQKAILFGSAAVNEHTENSDLDILIVVENQLHIKQVYSIVQTPYFSPIAVDWIVKTQKDFDQYKDIGGVCFMAHNFGKEIPLK